MMIEKEKYSLTLRFQAWETEVEDTLRLGRLRWRIHSGGGYRSGGSFERIIRTGVVLCCLQMTKNFEQRTEERSRMVMWKHDLLFMMESMLPSDSSI